MKKVKEFEDIYSVTLQVMKDSVMARDSVDYCYVLVCNRYNDEVLNMPFGVVMRKIESYGIPKYETVSRNWRKVQEIHEGLRGINWGKRHGAEHSVRKWAVNG